MENERLELIKKIEDSSLKLSSAKSDKASTISEINALEVLIDARTALINNLKEEEALVDSVIVQTTEKVQLIQETGNSLMEDYNELLRLRYRNKLLTSNYGYLWNSEKLSELITKRRVFKTFEKLLLAKGVEIEQLDQVTDTLKSDNQANERHKSYLVEEEQRQLDSLVNRKKELLAHAKNLTYRETQLLDVLNRQKKQREDYNRAIEAAIKGAIKYGTETADNKVIASTNNNYSVTGIAAKRGFLPWPLANPVITKRYGPHVHPTLPGITVTNHGIDFTSSSSEVQCIFAGKIISIAELNGTGKTIIVQHDADYYSVYTNLDRIMTSENQYLNQGDVIGIAKRNSKNRPELHFEFWQGKNNMNPKHWLKNN